jgi:CheY-like chemotaxis protein/GAF domain-containing protein
LALRPRILVFAGTDGVSAEIPAALAQVADLVHADGVSDGLSLLQRESFDGIFASADDQLIAAKARSLLQVDAILRVLEEGIAVVHPDGRILWANSNFEQWCGGAVQGQPFDQALGSPIQFCPDPAPLAHALEGKSVRSRLRRPGDQYLDMRFTPLKDAAGLIVQVIVSAEDVTAEVSQQQMLDAVHQAGDELVPLSTDQLAEMDPQERIELLKHNIRRLTHDLLHYDVIEIRLLDPVTGKLEPLLAEGMTPEAASRVLYAKEENNGVTGYVAATGLTYVCADAANDPRYLQGAAGARSSLTVPLMWDDKIIGTFNVESPKLNGFAPQDVQFAEIFSREVAASLHTLELLLVEKKAMVSQSIEAVNREVALPVDEILTTATTLLERWVGHEPEMVDKLKRILGAARQIKQSIQKVGEDMTPQFGRSVLSAPSKLKGMRVLVVDNDDRVRRSAHGILGRLGCIVETARDGQEALTMAKLASYDAMLTDIRLPDVTGYEMYSSLRKAQPNARVILMTGFGYDPHHSLVKARQEGLRFVLYKPFRVEQLLTALQSSETEAPSPAP